MAPVQLPPFALSICVFTQTSRQVEWGTARLRPTLLCRVTSCDSYNLRGHAKISHTASWVDCCRPALFLALGGELDVVAMHSVVNVNSPKSHLYQHLYQLSIVTSSTTQWRQWDSKIYACSQHSPRNSESLCIVPAFFWYWIRTTSGPDGGHTWPHCRREVIRHIQESVSLAAVDHRQWGNFPWMLYLCERAARREERILSAKVQGGEVLLRSDLAAARDQMPSTCQIGSARERSQNPWSARSSGAFWRRTWKSCRKPVIKVPSSRAGEPRQPFFAVKLHVTSRCSSTVQKFDVRSLFDNEAGFGRLVLETLNLICSLLRRKVANLSGFRWHFSGVCRCHWRKAGSCLHLRFAEKPVLGIERWREGQDDDTPH